MAKPIVPQGRKPGRLSPSRVGVYAVLVVSALLFLTPFWVMLVTSFKTMNEIRLAIS